MKAGNNVILSKANILRFLFSLFFSTLLLLQSKINFISIHQIFKENIIERITPRDIPIFLLYVILFCSSLIGIETIVSCLSKLSGKQLPKYYFILYAVVHFISGMIFILTCYPGTLISDSWNSIYQALGIWKISNHHPVLFTALVKVMLSIGNLFGDYNVGIFLFSVIQLLLLVLTDTSLLIWLNRAKLSPVLCIFFSAYYLFNPVFYTYSLMLQKDTLFSLSVSWMTLILAKMEWERNVSSYSLPYGLSLFCVSFFRNNGLFVAWIVTFILLILYRKIISNKTKMTFISVLVLFSFSILYIIN